MPLNGGSGSGAELNSWKEIAAFLEVNVRTAQRWEAQHGMPVRRFAGEKGRVAASTDELQAWRRRALQEKTPRWADVRFLQQYAAAVSAAALILAGLLVWQAGLSRRGGPPVAVRLEFKSLVVSDADGRELWRKSFPEPLGPEAYSSAVSGRTVWFGDIDGDGSIETVFAYHPAAQGRIGTTLYCFSARGREKWHFTAGRPVSDRSETYDGVFAGTDFVVADFGRGLGKMAAITSHSVSGHPNQVAVIDGKGAVRGEYWHSGHLDAIEAADLDGRGAPDILLAGVDNARRSAVLIALDPAHMNGASDADGTAMQFRDMPRAEEKTVLWFPRTCVNRVADRYNIAKNLRRNGAGLDVYVQERVDDTHSAVIYTLDGDLQLRQAKMSDRLQAVHEQLRREGKLDHDLQAKEIDLLRPVTRR